MKRLHRCIVLPSLTALLFLYVTIFLLAPAIAAPPQIEATKKDLISGERLIIDGHDFLYLHGEVYFGNAASYQNCTVTQPQTHSLWVDNRVTIPSVNLGSFSADENFYIFVRDANGDTSMGYGPVHIETPPRVKGASGDLKTGNSMSISGIGFGNKTNAEPIRYDRFEYGKENEKLDTASKGYWTVRPDKEDMRISSTQARTGSRSAESILIHTIPWTNGRHDKAWVNNVGFALTGKAYVSCWIYWDWGYGTKDTDNSYQIKALYLGDNDEGAADIPPGVYLMGWQDVDYQTDPDSYSQAFWHYNSLDTTLPSRGNNANMAHAPEFVNGHDIFAKEPGWYNIVIEIAPGTSGKWDGNAKFWISSPNKAYSYAEIGNQMILSPGVSTYDAIRIGWYLGSTDVGNTTIYYDDIYIDNSFARVELGDQPKYDACTKRELQLPTSWSETEVQVTIETGTFTTGEEVYLFVIDDKGNPSNGYGPLKIDSATQNTPDTKFNLLLTPILPQKEK